MRANAAPEEPSVPAVGTLLRVWRNARKVSQLELALRSGLSARHLSFMETGRSKPSRQALLSVAEALEMPLRERNRLLEAGGYARIFRQTPIDSREMDHVRRILGFILERHEPYGSLVIDRYWNLMMSNRAADRSLRAFTDPVLWTSEQPNVLRLVFHPLGVRRFVLNWTEFSHLLMLRVQRELGGPGEDDVAAALIAELQSYPDVPGRPAVAAYKSTSELILPMHLQKDGIEIRTFSSIMTLGTAQDLTLQELRVETFFPADDASDQVLRSLAESQGMETL